TSAGEADTQGARRLEVHRTRTFQPGDIPRTRHGGRHGQDARQPNPLQARPAQPGPGGDPGPGARGRAVNERSGNSRSGPEPAADRQPRTIPRHRTARLQTGPLSPDRPPGDARPARLAAAPRAEGPVRHARVPSASSPRLPLMRGETPARLLERSRGTPMPRIESTPGRAGGDPAFRAYGDLLRFAAAFTQDFSAIVPQDWLPGLLPIVADPDAERTLRAPKRIACVRTGAPVRPGRTAPGVDVRFLSASPVWLAIG